MSALIHTSSLATPLGEISFAVDDNGALVAITFGPVTDLVKLCGISPNQTDTLAPNPARTLALSAHLANYFANPRYALNLPVAPRIGTPFQRRVWQTLTRIPVASTWSYTRLATETGGGARAVGAAVGANPIALVWPCHRVIGADGSLTGYAGGLARKHWLLIHEGAILA